MKYTLLEHKESNPNTIECKYFMPKEVLIDKIDVLVVSFFGIYPEGTLGRKHAMYISKKTISGIIEFNPEAIILDFRELTYNWGNSLLSVFQDIVLFKDGENTDDEPSFPIIIAASSKSSDGLVSLLTPSTSKESPDFIFKDINFVLDQRSSSKR